MSGGPMDPDESAADEYSASQEEIARHSHGTGGDAPAAASLAEREALARDEEPFFENAEASDADADGDGDGDGDGEETRKTHEGGR